MSATARPKRPTKSSSAARPLAGLAHPALPRPVHLKPPPLRTANGHYRDERYASWLELFFDLVFAGAFGQLAGALQYRPTLATLGLFALVFTPIWWLWVQLSFYADRHESGDATYRSAFLAAMLLCIGLAASGPRAMAGDTAGFVVAFVLLRSLQLVLYARARRYLPATRQLYSWYLVFFAAGGALWLASLAVPVPVRYAFWGAGLITDAAGALATVLAAALITLAAVWLAWLTTAGRDGLGGPLATARFTAANLPIVAGVAAASAGLHLAILAADGGTAIAAGPRAALYGGVSICLLGTATLPSSTVTRRRRAVRVATAVAAMGLVFMGAIVLPVYLVPALAVILALGLAAETHPGWRPVIARRLTARQHGPPRPQAVIQAAPIVPGNSNVP